MLVALLYLSIAASSMTFVLLQFATLWLFAREGSLPDLAWLPAAGALALATVVWIGMRTPFRILGQVSHVLERMSRGDLRHRVNRVPWMGEAGKVAPPLKASQGQGGKAEQLTPSLVGSAPQPG